MRRREFVGLIGGAAAWPLMARAQQAKPVIGFLSSGAPEQSAEALKAFRSGLGEGGFVEGRNVAIEFRWGEGYDRLAAMASDLVQRKVTAIVAAGGVPSAKAAKAAADTIPIIFNVGGDPVRDCLQPQSARRQYHRRHKSQFGAGTKTAGAAARNDTGRNADCAAGEPDHAVGRAHGQGPRDGG
jgi:hypothetical protein